VKADHPRLRALGLTGKSMSIVWVQNADHTWWNVVHKKPIPVIEATRLTLDNFPRGRYRIEFWDTWAGVVTREADVQSSRGSAVIALPPIERDIALKLVRLN
jgi:hypothetical protein